MLVNLLVVYSFGANHLFKQSTVMTHRASQILSIGEPAVIADVDCVSGTVMLDNLRIVNGQVRRLSFEIVHRITARLHCLIDQLVSFGNGLTRVIHEVVLHGAPFAGETFRLRTAQRPDMVLTTRFSRFSRMVSA
jgi:hypothetical protein